MTTKQSNYEKLSDSMATIDISIFNLSWWLHFPDYLSIYPLTLPQTLAGHISRTTNPFSILKKDLKSAHHGQYSHNSQVHCGTRNRVSG